MTSKLQVTTFKNEHLWQVSASMRQCDRDECLASHGLCSTRALLESVKCSTYLRVFAHNGQAFAILGTGASNLFSNRGMPWLLGTDEIRKHQTWFLKETRRQVQAMLRRHIFLENWVDARNITSIKWLEWLGFRLDDPEPYGVAQLPFRRFEMRG